jgi:hypothetical protein
VRVQILVFWVVILSDLAGVVTEMLAEHNASIFKAEVTKDGGSMFLQNVSNHLRNYTVSQPTTHKTKIRNVL